MATYDSSATDKSNQDNTINQNNNSNQDHDHTNQDAFADMMHVFLQWQKQWQDSIQQAQHLFTQNMSEQHLKPEHIQQAFTGFTSPKPSQDNNQTLKQNPFLFNPFAILMNTHASDNQQKSADIRSQNPNPQSQRNEPFYFNPFDIWFNNPITQSMTDTALRINNQMLRMSGQNSPTSTSVTFDLLQGWQHFAEMMQHNPGVMVDEQTNLWKNQWQLWQNTLLKMSGQQPDAVVTPEKGDKRFNDAEWDNNPWFDYLKQYYLLTSQAMMQTIDELEGVDDKTRQRLSFFTRQWINAVAPTNFLFTNPEVLRLTIETQGQNLIDGLKQLAVDLENSADTLNIRMTDQSAFRVGDNIATAKGQVVYQNYLFELIQYAPSTEKVYQKPLVLVPPWINKFYIMDLREKNSFIRWAVAQGHTVFVLSWANPTPHYKDIGMIHYMHDGLLTALDEVERITGESQANVVGYCIGGMLTSLTLGWLAKQGQSNRVASATLWASIIDFSDPGDIGVFVDEKIVNAINQQNDQLGVFDGRMMGVSFSLLRENSLYWNYFVQNYLKGERPVPFDLLYWNSDCTNVTASLHQFLLGEFYLGNKLQAKGELLFDRVQIDLREVKTPVFSVATLQDHIAKWKSCYPATQVFGGQTKFVLGESGHIAGIMNAPGGKYGYYRTQQNMNTDTSSYPVDADQWYETAEFVQDSWWHEWQGWLATTPDNASFMSKDKLVPARQVGQDHQGQTITTYGNAPGTYVLVTAEQALKSNRRPVNAYSSDT